nr:immunoglobulin light chain junction region [Macaca mulatta]
CLQGYTTPLAF